MTDTEVHVATVRVSVGHTTLELAGEVVHRRSSGDVVTRTGTRRAVREPHSDTKIILSEPPSTDLLRLAGRHAEVVVDRLVLHNVRIYVRSEPPWEVVVHP